MRRPRRRLSTPAITAITSFGALAAMVGLLLAVLVAPALAGDVGTTRTSQELSKSPVVTASGPSEQTHTLAQTLSPPAPAPTVRLRRPERRSTQAPTNAHSAADPAVTIADFNFGPKATTVHVGETVTWTNAGPSPHSATANNGSFDTGVLTKGQTGSHTFTAPGTYTYFCKVHPFMHGTIVVLASTAATTTPAPTASTPAAAPTTPTTAGATATTPASTTAAGSTTTAQASTPTLPITGMDLVLSGVIGSVLIGLGIGLRRALS